MATYRNLTLSRVQKLASELALELTDKKAVIGLIGELGSGKTTFTKAFAHQLGVKKITSPTFVVTHLYEIKNRLLYHLDFYRLHQPKQLVDLGLDEILAGPNLVLIEWVDKFPNIKQRCDILISLQVRKDNKRDVSIETKN